MTRRRLFAALAGASTAAAQERRPNDHPCDTVQVVVDKGPSVTVTLPQFSKDQVADIAATFLGREQRMQTQKLKELFKSAKDVTLTVTTRGNCKEP